MKDAMEAAYSSSNLLILVDNEEASLSEDPANAVAPPDPLIRMMSRLIAFEPSGDCNEDTVDDEKDQLMMIISALATRLVAVEAQLVKRVEPALVTDRSKLRTMEERLKSVGTTMSMLQNSFEGLEQRMQENESSGAYLSERREVGGSADIDPQVAMVAAIVKGRELWGRVCTELGQGLHAFHKNNKYYLELETRTAATSHTVMQRLEELHEQTDALLRALNPIGDVKPHQLLMSVNDPLERLLRAFDSVLKQNEEQLRGRTDHVATLWDICARVPELPKHIYEAQEFSLNLLELNISKVELKRSVEDIEKRLSLLTPASDFEATKEMLLTALQEKASMSYVDASLHKKASLTEVWKFREAIFKQIDSIKLSLKNGGLLEAGAGSSSLEESSVDRADAVYIPEERQLQQGGVLQRENSGGKAGELLSRRFDILNGQFGRVMEVLDALVTRRELEEALISVMAEVRGVRAGLIDPSLIRDKLSQKANVDDLQRLIKSLERAMGGRLDDSNEAAVVQSRCLVCDKPASSATRSPVSDYPQSQYYDKSLDAGYQGGRSRSPVLLPGHKGGIGVGLITDSCSQLEETERRKQQTSNDILVLSHTIDLPPITSVSNWYIIALRLV